MYYSCKCGLLDKVYSYFFQSQSPWAKFPFNFSATQASCVVPNSPSYTKHFRGYQQRFCLRTPPTVILLTRKSIGQEITDIYWALNQQRRRHASNWHTKSAS
ncbi:hypothetical protein XENTR_v10018964 [Xenopus tropicalis]|nr:hypothetical protein XENTR_v10018964 [Xenopus tropicalis]